MGVVILNRLGQFDTEAYTYEQSHDLLKPSDAVIACENLQCSLQLMCL